MKRSSVSSDAHESCKKPAVAKRGWGFGSLLHGLAGYVRPKNSSSKEKPTGNAVNSETETLSTDFCDYKTTNSTRPVINERVPDVNESLHTQVNVIANKRHGPDLSKYESSLSRSSTFSHTHSPADYQQRTPLLPRFRRDVRNSKTYGSPVETSMALPSSSLRRRQSFYSNYSDVGILPSVKLMQSDTRPVLGEHNSRMVGTDNIRVRVAPPDPIRATSLCDTPSELSTTQPSSVPDTPSVVEALRDKRKRACADDEQAVPSDHQFTKKLRADTTEAAAAACSADDRVQVVVTATPVTSHCALMGVKNAIDASYVSSRRHLSRRSSLASGRDGRISRDSIMLQSVSRRSSICSLAGSIQLHTHEEDRVTDSPAASVPSSGRNTPALLSDVSGAEVSREQRQLQRRAAGLSRDPSLRNRLTPLPDEVSAGVSEPVRRNYCLTVKDLEADRRKDLERAQSLKSAAGAVNDDTSSQTRASDAADVFRSPATIPAFQVNVAASSEPQLNTTSSVKTSADLLPMALNQPTTAVNQLVAGSSVDQPASVVASKSTHVEYGAGDSSQVVVVPLSFTLQAGSGGDRTSSGVDSSSLCPASNSSSLPPSQVTVPGSSLYSEGVPQPVSTAPSPTAVEPLSTSVTHVDTQMALPPPSVGLPSLSSTSQSNVSNSGTSSSVTSSAVVGGFMPVFGNISQTVSLGSFNLPAPQTPVVKFGSAATSVAVQPPMTQPAVDISSANPAVFSHQPLFSSPASCSSQPSVPAATAVASFTSASGLVVTQPSLSRAVSNSFSFSLKPTAMSTFSDGGNIATVTFGSVPNQTSFSSQLLSSSAAGVNPPVAPFGKPQQPSFNPVFGNSDSQQAMTGFGSFGSTTAVPSFGSQPTTISAVRSSASGMFPVFGNQSTSSSFGDASASPIPFASTTALQTGSLAFGSSVPKTGVQSTSSSFGSFAGMSSSGHAFGSSTSQTAPSVFGSSSVPNSNSQTNNNTFGSFTGMSAGSNPFSGVAPATSSSSLQQGSSAFGSSARPVYNGLPSTVSTAQQSLPNGFHKPTASSGGPFAFTGKIDQSASGMGSPFSFGQSTNDVNGFPVPASVPAFGGSTPASSFTFGNMPSFGTPSNTGNNSPFVSPSPGAAGVPSFSIGSGSKTGTASARRTGHHSRQRGARR